jgi:hypothetical protein
MATDNLGLTYENRTLQFYGAAYGNTPVTLTATINGTSVFSGEVPTIDSPLPSPSPPIPTPNVLFSINESSLFPTNWQGTYPMSISVTGGDGAVFGFINSNYMEYIHWPPTRSLSTANSNVIGNVFTIGNIISGSPAVGQLLLANIEANISFVGNATLVSGNDNTWILEAVGEPNNYHDIAVEAMGPPISLAGNATGFMNCYNGTPANSENTPDPRSSVTIDGTTQVPPKPKSYGTWTWLVPTGSTIAYNLNVSLGNCAQA